MMRDHRIRYYAMADYSDGAELDELIKAIIDRTAKNEALESKFFDCKNEQIRVDRQNSDDQKEKIELLIELESSRSFASTHATVEKMRRVDTWTQEEREAIFRCKNVLFRTFAELPEPIRKSCGSKGDVRRLKK